MNNYSKEPTEVFNNLVNGNIKDAKAGLSKLKGYKAFEFNQLMIDYCKDINERIRLIKMLTR